MVPRSRVGKWPDNGRHDQNGRLLARAILAEMQEIAERMRGDDLLADPDLVAADRDCPDAEIRPLMRHAGMRQHLHCGGGAAHQRRVPDQRPGMAEPAPRRFGHQPNWSQDVAVCLVCIVKHDSLPCAPLSRSRGYRGTSNRNGRPLRSIYRRDHPIAKTSYFQRYICLDKALGNGAHGCIAQPIRKKRRRFVIVPYRTHGIAARSGER